ncbi:MAG TPA: hypothetical protein VEY88_19380 [Archangium sp.]|nr:hypothetical protein [Archangium sp.]
MMNDPTTWVVLILTFGVVVALSLWLGRGLHVRRDSAGGMSLDIERQRAPRRPSRVRVANGAEIRGSQVGDIAGTKTEGDVKGPAHDDHVEVFQQGKLSDSTARDIVGVKRSGGPGDGRS